MHPMSDTPNDPTRCPLCGGDNRCAMELERATGQPQPPCWCVDAAFPPDLLARLPQEAEGKACICAACVARFAGQPLS
ncbi:cysteine-rich CWC family protein [Hydrogenophaga flava]|uniref:cysteine-rich CWC family protein n=1 Tax=Hydrogenophaga flava TaxID=65657 RepID=UPI0009FD6A86|nr:cysteine-rich CWC family protein [Hydrogenophaga flava]